MTVFKTYLKIVKANKIPIIFYTILLILFGGMSLKSNSNNVDFTTSKPKISIINYDNNEGVTKNIITYLSNNTKVVDINEDNVDDALFYRKVSYVIYIPKNYRNDFLSGSKPELVIKQTSDYDASLSNIILEKYLNTIGKYQSQLSDEEAIINYTNETLSKSANVQLISSYDTNKFSGIRTYYNFANYSILAGLIYVVSMVLYSFNKKNVKNRTIISGMNYKKYNKYLLISNGLFALTMWLVYTVLGYLLLGNILFTINGLFYIINSLLFVLTSLTLAFLIGNLNIDKNAINGLVSVISLGSSFLCGAFVPSEYLPSLVLKIAHILPSYYYVNTNDILKTLNNFSFNSLKQICFNFMALFIFFIIFILLTNILTRKKQKIAS